MSALSAALAEVDDPENDDGDEEVRVDALPEN
jgi:hypothetical protein